MSENVSAPPPSEPRAVPPSGAAPPPNDPAAALNNHIAALMHTGDSGAKWFYWVAGLSLVNSLMQLFGGGFYFPVGLGVTSMADEIAAMTAQETPDAATAAKAIFFGFNVIVALIVCGFGWLSCKRILFVFALGMFLYLLDGLLFLIVQDWMSIAFHAFALYSMFGGFMAYRQLSALQRQVTQSKV